MHQLTATCVFIFEHLPFYITSEHYQCCTLDDTIFVSTSNIHSDQTDTDNREILLSGQ